MNNELQRSSKLIHAETRPPVEMPDKDPVKNLHRDGNTAGGLWSAAEWNDPRKGDRSALVDALKDKETQ